MGLRIKNYWDSLKNPIFKGGEGCQEKPIYRGGVPKKEGLGQLVKSDLRKKGGGVFEGWIDIPMHTKDSIF